MAEGSKKPEPRYEGGSGIAGAIVRNLISLLFVGIAVMSVYNVFVVGDEVMAMAKETACQGQPLPCTAQFTRVERTPFSHSFTMYTSAGSSDKSVVCRRQYIFLGDYSCSMKGALVSADVVPSASASPSSSASGAAPVQPRFPTKNKLPLAPKPQPSANAAPAASP